MNIVMNLVLALQILAALVMIGLVLIQHGKGADMGASFGSGASGSLFGATGSANFLSRSTAVCAAVFFICTLSLAYTSNDRPKAAATTSILDRPANAGSAPPSIGSASGAAAIPLAPVAPGASSAAAIAPAASTPAPAAPAAASGAGAIPQK
jgi:preprotein translocase subunit SecG